MWHCDIQSDRQLPVLRRLIKKYASDRLCRCVLITHVLPTAEDYIRAVNEAFPVVLVIAIPYSFDLETIQSLQKDKIPVYLPLSVDEILSCAGQKIQQILEEDQAPLFVQEVGGYLAGRTKELSSFPHFLGIIEDTNHGHWSYEKVEYYPFPVLSIAQSPIKAIEDTAIGDAVIYSVERIFREEFRGIIQGLSSGVIGYGKIGTSSAIALRGRESSVTVYDLDPAKCIRARLEGFRIAPLVKILSESSLIIGCTGKTSVRVEHVPYIRDQAILVSASSKNEEFDLLGFAQECQLEELSSVVRRYRQADGRCFYLLNRGIPVNFRDQSILGYLLDMIYSELFLCMCSIADRKISPGLHHSSSWMHNEVAGEWLEVYEPSFEIRRISSQRSYFHRV